MTRKPRSLIKLLLLSTLMLAWAGSAFAGRNIIVDSVTVTVSSLNTPTPLNSTDTILVRNGGTLFVDDAATIGSLAIGDSTTPGNAVFNSIQAKALTVTGDIQFGPDARNFLDMTLSTANVIRVGGSFLTAGQGSFRAGAATIEYNSSTAQQVNAYIGATGTPIQYKNLVLSGVNSSWPTNVPLKYCNFGVTVQGTLTITNQAVPTGGSISYGPLASLVYAGVNVPQTTTVTEWPAASGGALNVPVTINNTAGLTLDSDKGIAAFYPYSLTVEAGIVNDNGHALTVQGNILNGNGGNAVIQGPGQLILAGTGAQTLAGLGTYGNVTVKNNTTLPSSPIPAPGILINGRLTIQNGKLTLPVGTAHAVSLLTYGGSDKVAGTYGSTNSAATIQDNLVFDSTAPGGVITVLPKPTPIVSANFTSPISYGTASVTVKGTVAPPAGPPNLAAYGDGAQQGEFITNILYVGFSPAGAAIQTNVATLDNSGGYSLALNTAALTFTNYTVISYYKGGVNLAPSSSTPQVLAVNPLQVVVVPKSGQNKTYGQADPVLTYNYAPALISTDAFTGALTRADALNGNAGTYHILQGTLALSTNYTIVFTNVVDFTINKLGINVTMISTNKVYGTADDSAVINPLGGSNVNYTISPQLVGSDTLSGNLARTNTSVDVGSYFLTLGTLSAGNNYSLAAVNTATLTITKLPVTVNFNSPVGGKVYGDPDPAQFTYVSSPSPLPLNDKFTSTYSTNRDAGQDVGTYIIRPTPPSGITNNPGNVAIDGNKAGNYTVTYTTTGVLVINQKTVTVSAVNTNMFYGQPDLPVTVYYQGFIQPPGQNGVPGQNAPKVPATTSPANPVSSCSVPGSYSFSIATLGSDPNYKMTAGTPGTAAVTVNPAPLNVTAQNVAKVANSSTNDPSNYSVSYYNTFLKQTGFVCSDTATAGTNAHDAFTVGSKLTWSGTGVSATSPGVYPILPGGWASTKYAINNVAGWLTISPSSGPGTTTNNTDVTWATGDSLAFFINRANGGTAGTSPGWSLQLYKSLTITPGSQFRLDLVTLLGNAAGLMEQFDPTRPYAWEIVRTANGITGFDPAAFNLNAYAIANQSPDLFQNKTFNGQFSVTQSGNSLYLNFTPMGSTGGFAVPGPGYKVPVPAGYDVGTDLNDTSKLLGNVYNRDVPMLWLQPSKTSISPQESVTINLNVGNLKGTLIVGSEAYINFDSRFFDATTGPNGPVVAAGGGVWNNLIFRTWNVEGSLDTVIAVSLNNINGTSADGTMATIKLTPTRTATGTSRVVFRHDGDPKADNSGPLTTDLVPASGTAAILPARVMTDEITITGENNPPLITSIDAYQMQPYFGKVTVTNGTASTRTEVVRTTSTGALNPTDSGQVVFTINASDNPGGVGLSGPPTLVLTKAGSPDQPIPCSTTVSPFVYYWTVPGNIPNGSWIATVVATDTIVPPNSTTKQFTLVVNTAEVSGVVELDNFAGTNRTVTFKSGGIAGLSMSNQWDLSLKFTSGPILSAGAYQNVAALAGKINQPVDSVSVWLRNGAVLNLSTLVAELVSPLLGWNVPSYVYTNEFGSITSLPILASQLWNPTRNIDVYVRSQLSPSTLTALATYIANPTTFNASVLTRDLLYDFNNNLVLQVPSIWDPVRFAGVAQSCNPTQPDNTVAVNRCLLASAYPTYVPGNLNPVTAQGLSVYNPSVGSPSLATNILADFATLSYTSSLWPVPTHQYDQGLYNQTMFLGVTLSPTTSAMLTTQQTGLQLVLLNQYLLQDAFVGLYQKPPLSPATLAAAAAFDPNHVELFEIPMTADLNALISGGVSIYNVNTFASFTDAITWNTELMSLLLAQPPVTGDLLVRENRLLLETAYNVELSKSVLSNFRLVQVPNSAIANQATPTQISAKASWNLRVTRPYGANVNFVNDGVPGWTVSTDFYLRGGDVTSDNQVNLFDYNILRQYWPPQTFNQKADINGDGAIGYGDYYQLTTNWGKIGDPEVTN